MKQIKFPNFVQHALKGAALESVAELPSHPVEGRIVLDKTGGANDGQAVMYSGAAWSPLGVEATAFALNQPVTTMSTNISEALQASDAERPAGRPVSGYLNLNGQGFWYAGAKASSLYASFIAQRYQGALYYVENANGVWSHKKIWYDGNVERGTESTGHYIKLPNGMMQIWRVQTINVSSWTWTATDSLYRATVTLDNFPFTFTGKPTVHKTVDMYSGVHMWGGGCTVEPSTTNPGNYIVWSSTTTPPTALKIAYTATGWWQ